MHQQLLLALRNDLRDRLEDGISIRGSNYEECLLTHAQIVGSLAVVKHLSNLDYESLISGVSE